MPQLKVLRNFVSPPSIRVPFMWSFRRSHEIRTLRHAFQYAAEAAPPNCNGGLPLDRSPGTTISAKTETCSVHRVGRKKTGVLPNLTSPPPRPPSLPHSIFFPPIFHFAKNTINSIGSWMWTAPDSPLTPAELLNPSVCMLLDSFRSPSDVPF